MWSSTYPFWISLKVKNFFEYFFFWKTTSTCRHLCVQWECSGTERKIVLIFLILWRKKKLFTVQPISIFRWRARRIKFLSTQETKMNENSHLAQTYLMPFHFMCIYIHTYVIYIWPPPKKYLLIVVPLKKNFWFSHDPSDQLLKWSALPSPHNYGMEFS